MIDWLSVGWSVSRRRRGLIDWLIVCRLKREQSAVWSDLLIDVCRLKRERRLGGRVVCLIDWMSVGWSVSRRWKGLIDLLSVGWSVSRRRSGLIDWLIVCRLKREQAAEWSAFRDYELQEGEDDLGNGIDFRSEIFRGIPYFIVLHKDYIIEDFPL